MILKPSWCDYFKTLKRDDIFVFINGLYHYSLLWVSSIKALAEASKHEKGAILNRTSFYLIDLPGYGKSSCPDNFFKPETSELNEYLMTTLMHMWKNKVIGKNRKVNWVAWGFGENIIAAYSFRYLYLCFISILLIMFFKDIFQV